MWRLKSYLLGSLIFLGASFAEAQSIRVTSWNLHDFPSGVYNLRKPEVEPERIDAVAKAIKAIDPDILLVQEIRDEDACKALTDALKPAKYNVVICSAFKDRMGIPLFQQVAILSKLPATDAVAERWHSVGSVDPLRGFAFAIVTNDEHRTAFYCLHLKSNLARGGNREQQGKLNALKRQLATDQVIRHLADTEQKLKRKFDCVIIAGDFNTNMDQFPDEVTLETLEKAGFASGFEGLQLKDRVTHPGIGRWPDATFDYVFTRGFRTSMPPMIAATPVSDHYPVTRVTIP